MWICFPAGRRMGYGALRTGSKENFVSVGLGQIAVPGFFPAVLLPVFPEFFPGQASRKMEEPDLQRPDPLCSLEYHLLSGLYGSIPVSRHTIRGRT